MKGILGMVFALLGSIITSVILAYIFKMPAPVAGSIGPYGDISIAARSITEVLQMVFQAWFLLGIMGGFAVVLFIGFLTGIYVGENPVNSKRWLQRVACYASISGGVPLIMLLVLDLFIGPL